MTDTYTRVDRVFTVLRRATSPVTAKVAARQLKWTRRSASAVLSRLAAYGLIDRHLIAGTRGGEFEYHMKAATHV